MIEITIPKLGLTMESAKVVRWEYNSGDEVKKEETILVIETDKVSFDMPAPADGIIHPIVPEGTTCAVEETIGYLAKDRKEYETIIKEHPAAKIKTTKKVEPLQVDASLQKGKSISPSSAGPKVRIKASPLARSMAAKHNLDLATIMGSGPGGRIIKADILQALESGPAVAEKRVFELPGEGSKHATVKEVLEKIPIKGVRRIIFENMYQSLTHSAQLTLHTDANAEQLIDLRERLNIDGQKISYNAVLMKIVAMALRQHPKINSTVEGETIHVWRQIHIGLAMEANDELIVPVVRNPDLKTIREIDQEIIELINKTKENRLSPDDLANGTFTISNLGFADIDHFTPIIRPPESAILGVGRIVKKPIIQDDQVISQARIGLSLTFDHRIIDGAPGARFLKTIKNMIENPLLMIC
ncbi:MAG: 2-oxo acid dehydrogenase subunit E2 [Deltaproteobacteria bacterium]|nr:2-oxo acid dehydrogenase subunit E2 [Deltaproteobacteria bacterium]